MKILLCVMLFPLMAALQLSAAPLPGQTLISGSDATLQRDVLADLFTAEKALSGGCKKSRVVDTRITQPPKTIGQERGTGLAVAQWTERWTIDRCGKNVFYTIHFDSRGSAGTMFKIQAPLK
ncbi:MAG: hypothetical protein QOE95_2003 [Gaiellaceae bacterium]|nr:hypothetical protein [Gaiellaceae bacterium]